MNKRMALRKIANDKAARERKVRLFDKKLAAAKAESMLQMIRLQFGLELAQEGTP